MNGFGHKNQRVRRARKSVSKIETNIWFCIQYAWAFYYYCDIIAYYYIFNNEKTKKVKERNSTSLKPIETNKKID